MVLVLVGGLGKDEEDEEDVGDKYDEEDVGDKYDEDGVGDKDDEDGVGEGHDISRRALLAAQCRSHLKYLVCPGAADSSFARKVWL
jgi:hypothetical protein